jgi:uncharacterized protein YjiS (DUF1127 family)
MTTFHQTKDAVAARRAIDLIVAGLSRLIACFNPVPERRLRSRRGAARDARSQRHFGSLDDQTLNDLGLQRSELRAAEYGVLPGDQALRQTENESLPSVAAEGSSRGQSRT